MHTFPEPKKIFENGNIYSRDITLRSYIPPVGSEETPIIEISLSFKAHPEKYDQLQAYQELTGHTLETELFGGDLIVRISNHPYIEAKFYLEPDMPINDVLLSAVDVFRRDVIELMIDKHVDEIKHKLRHMEEVEA